MPTEKSSAPSYVGVGVRLKEFRDRAGLTQRELAEKLSVDPATVARWETGKTRLDADMLGTIGSPLGVTPLDFYGSPVNPILPRAALVAERAASQVVSIAIRAAEQAAARLETN